MENLELTSEEKKELEKRGFYVKKNFSLITIIGQIWIISGLFFSVNLLLSLVYPTYINSAYILWILFGVYSCYMFLTGYITIYSNKWIISFGKKEESNHIAKKNIRTRMLIFQKILHLFIFPFSKKGILGNATKERKGLFLIGLLPIVYIIGGSILWGKYILNLLFNTEITSILTLILSGYLSIILFVPFWFLIGKTINIINPLYAFGNLGEKIQKLTPEIESQSNLIQSEFEKDMNFSVLHTGFEKLSSTFSEIASLVLRLEKVEERANKGNLFDSEKYINSLRSDIVAPLASLKTFLEKQKIELLKSQKELTRVRVGGSEESGNIELTSKRSESLISELEVNIGALSEMIGKMRG